ncbi:Pantoate-beta-alanine ligase [Neocallimastix lanati (nom. inval.)]|jgi:pantoate--beta-alanine ligase|uniref:Pantoate--beta-alanine ligase n=1 Tax=Neocallimastix californiae TaxID=1754190 RepID=A0A1Y2BW43_9FUNG|nr:Pantoate-beta-alanine ligase [Neocallimastix sp. JGI-2020a]ORY38979.1 Pantoate-beta-alanine ligase [Neocallimastix californiae]|eukprot:ORY38979.1 Pantoate-beta-alanine ligase [Neocallimastix californiae]
MQVFHEVEEYRKTWMQWRKAGEVIGFIPTMGCLHDGHMSLVKAAKQKCTKIVVSVFVNPSQFSPDEDYDAYPRTIDNDVELLKQNGVDAVFVPSVNTMYPSGITMDVNKQEGAFVEVLGVSHQMEGQFRPHFFRGVCTVVCKLFNIVRPDKTFFGQKDIQQTVVLRRMVRDLFLPIEFNVVPIYRQEDGLAMSSRNRYLSDEQRKTACVFSQALNKAKELFDKGVRDRTSIIKIATDTIEANKNVRLEYLSLAHPTTLDELETVGEDGAILSGAMYVGTTRLIDNITLGFSF